MFVQRMDQSVLSQLLKLTDFEKLFKCVSDPGGVDILNGDLRSVHQWLEDWQILFNADICKVMHFGAKMWYSINNTIQNDVEEGKEEEEKEEEWKKT